MCYIVLVNILCIIVVWYLVVEHLRILDDIRLTNPESINRMDEYDNKPPITRNYTTTPQPIHDNNIPLNLRYYPSIIQFEQAGFPQVIRNGRNI